MKLLKVGSFLNSPPPPPTQSKGSGRKEARGCTFLGPGRTEGLETISKVSCFSLSRAPALSFLPDPPSMDGEAPLFSGSGRSRRMRATGSHCLPMGAPPSDPPDLHMVHVLPSPVTFTTWSPASTFPQEFRSPVLLPQTQEIQSPCSLFCRIQVSRHLAPSFPGPQKFKPEASPSSLLSRLRNPDPVFLGSMIFSLSLFYFFCHTAC